MNPDTGGVGAGMHDLAADDLGEEFFFADKRGEGHTTADGFPKNGQIGREAEEFLRAT